MSSVAIYVHIPWCASICPYCDFDKQATDFRLVDHYIDALARHIDASPPREAHSLFFGGGTPSLLTPARLGRIIDASHARFDAPSGWEVTVEANPSDVVAHKMEAYLQAGVTRVSLGVQSLNDDDLRFLGRRHTADKAVRAVEAIRAAGCRDLSLDLMYALPHSTVETVVGTIDRMTSLEPDHISCYALTLETDTPMGAQAERGELALVPDDSIADQYAAIQTDLEAAGYVQYELSNWARPGHQSIHNLTYWRNGEWVGLGAGASGSFMGARYKRTPIVRDYIAAAQVGAPGYVYEEPWTRAMEMRDTVMLGLRLAEGVSEPEFATRFGVSLTEYCGERLPGLVRAGVLEWNGDRLALAPASYFICNAVLAEILPDVEVSATTS